MPSEVLLRAKYLLLDGIACALVASHLPWSSIASEAIFNIEPSFTSSDPKVCVVIGWGEDRRLPPLAAALPNSTFTQGFERDDYHSTAPLHSNAILLPALLSASTIAAQDRAAPRIAGGDLLLLEYCIGIEVGPRVGLALHGADELCRGWHSGAIQGPSASAAAVSSLLKLPAWQIEDALRIACTQAGGLMSAQYGSMAKRMQHGFASRNGLFATLMAKHGYTGIKEVYEVSYGGFLPCLSLGTSFQPPNLPDEICEGLGEKWEIWECRSSFMLVWRRYMGQLT